MTLETIIDGLAGGLAATIAMTALMMALGDDDPPPTALFISKYAGDGEPAEYMMPGMALHILYGIVAGGVFAVIAIGIDVVSVASVELGLAWGLAYGVLLFVGAAVFWMKLVLGMDPEPKMVGLFLFFHLVYGAVLGTWVGIGVVA